MSDRDLVRRLRRYEAGQSSDIEALEMFAALVRSGRASELPQYARGARDMIEAGFITSAGEVTDVGRDFVGAPKRKEEDAAGPIVSGRHNGIGRQLRVYSNRVEVETVWGTTKTLPMRQIHEVKRSWSGKVTLKTSAGDFEFFLMEAQEIEQAIRENM